MQEAAKAASSKAVAEKAGGDGAAYEADDVARANKEADSQISALEEGVAADVESAITLLQKPGRA